MVVMKLKATIAVSKDITGILAGKNSAGVTHILKYINSKKLCRGVTPTGVCHGDSKNSIMYICNCVCFSLLRWQACHINLEYLIHSSSASELIAISCPISVV